MKRTAALGLVLLSGCVTTRFAETVIDVDGSSSVTEYAANAVVPPFSKLEPSNHNLHYKWGDNELGIGQFSEGIDATPQLEAAALAAQTLVQVIPVLPAIIDALRVLETSDATDTLE